jgi:hypothetical protein
VLVERERPDAEVVTPPMEVLKTPPAPAPPAAQESPRRQEPRPFRATPEFPSRGDVARAPAEAPAAPAAQAERSEARMSRSTAEPTPEAELERIARLRADGRHEEADKALAEFRRRYPDYKISEAMLEKVERSRAR